MADDLLHAPDRPRSPWNGHAATHVVIAVGGVALLVQTAAPLRYDGWFGSSGATAWLLLLLSAVVFGGVGGLVQGLALARAHEAIAIALALAVSVPALWMPFLVVGRWFEDQDYPFGTSTLFQPIIGWLVFVVLLAGTSAIFAVRLGRNAAEPRSRTR